MKRIVIIDGQGGGMGRAIIERIRRDGLTAELVAAGTNAMATSAMMKAGADAGASGESAVIWNCARADLIVGPIGIIAAGSMMGELSGAMAEAIGSSTAQKILLPVSRCHIDVVGVSDSPLPARLDDMMRMIRSYMTPQDRVLNESGGLL
ncbi:MAG: DUF3842 family protein [Eubacteriales bacterium]|nr:DUF3842 family protein [Eubacteriales bacterium]MDD3866461.1 DUF3842 family protein [Eubacteriales bacterium]MDD4462012.1 DUF3842 family protein [Eubacteriales bacterium]